MASSIAAPQQYKQPSRHGKKAWRKNIDVSEVSSGLEEKRKEEIQGGVISDLPSDALFTADTTGDANVQASYRKKHKPLKVDEILALRSAVPAVESRKRKGDLTGTGILPAKKARKDFVSHRELERLRGVAYGGNRGDQKAVSARDDTPYDPWADDTNVVGGRKTYERLDFLEEKKPVRAPDTLKQAPVALTASGKAPPAVRKPEAGKSYNPVFQDWDEVFTKAGDAEIAAERRRLEAARAQEAREARALEVAAAVEEAEKRRDMEDSEWEESEWEGIQSDRETATNAAPKESKRKTKAERNRIQRRKEAERKSLHDRKVKEKEKQAAEVAELAAKQRRKAQTRNERVLRREQDQDDLGDEDVGEEEEVLRRKIHSKIPVPEAPLEVVLPEELQDSLRLLKPEGDLIKDRYRHMIVAGKIEPRKRVGQLKKPRREVTEKWSYKDWKLPTV